DVAAGEVVVAAERLVLLQALGAVDHRGALAVGALVGAHAAQLGLGEVRQLADDVAGGQLVVVGDRRLRLPDPRAAGGLGLALDGLGGAGRRPVVARRTAGLGL